MLPSRSRTSAGREVATLRAEHDDLDDPRRSVYERVAAFGGQARAEAIRHAAEGSAKAVTKSPAPELVRPKRRECPPPAPEVRLDLEEFSGGWDWSRGHSTNEEHRISISQPALARCHGRAAA